MNIFKSVQVGWWIAARNKKSEIRVRFPVVLAQILEKYEFKFSPPAMGTIVEKLDLYAWIYSESKKSTTLNSKLYLSL